MAGQPRRPGAPSAPRGALVRTAPARL